MELADIFPAFAVRLTCGPLELRGMTQDDIPAVVATALAGIQAEDVPVPFLNAWHLAPADKLPLNTAQFYWSRWASFSPEAWSLMLVVRRDGEVVGMQDLFTKADFRVTRSLESGSWLGRAHHGKGTGTLMRQMVATLCFDHLGATEMVSAAMADNPSSRAVSRKVGYADNGTTRFARDGECVDQVHFRLTPETFVRPPEPVVVEGAEAFRAAIGV